MEIEATTQKKLRDEFAEECRMLEAEKRFAIRRNADEIHARYEEYFKSAQQELKEKLQVGIKQQHNIMKMSENSFKTATGRVDGCRCKTQ